jgi:hypothetical protein
VDIVRKWFVVGNVLKEVGKDDITRSAEGS